MKTAIGIHGACGRTGRRIVDLAHADPDITLAAALDAPNHPLLGRDIGEIAGVGPLGVRVANELPLHTRLDCMLDFSTPAGTMAILPTCLDRRIPILVATTGHSAEQRAEIASAAHFIAVLHAPSTWHHGLVADYWDTVNVDAPELDLYRQHLRSPVLDAGCGAGRLLVPLRSEGFDVDGCDASADMIERCRGRYKPEE